MGALPLRVQDMVAKLTEQMVILGVSVGMAIEMLLRIQEVEAEAVIAMMITGLPVVMAAAALSHSVCTPQLSSRR